MSLDLTITLVNYNAGQYIIDCLDSIYKNTKDLNFKVIVSDNGSTDGSLEQVERQFPQAKIIRNNKNLGYGAALNRGIDKAKGKYFLVLNPDTVVLPESLNKLVEFMENNQEVGLVGPKIHTFKNELQKSCYRFPKVREAMKGSYFLHEGFDYTKIGETEWIEGSCLMLRDKSLEKFDENYHLFFEETDLCYRLKKQGWKIAYFPEAVIKHHIGEGGSKHINRLSHRHKSLKYFFNKHYGKKHVAKMKLISLADATSISLKMIFKYLTKPQKRHQIKHDLLLYWKHVKNSI